LPVEMQQTKFDVLPSTPAFQVGNAVHVFVVRGALSGIGVREAPDIHSQKTGAVLQCGEAFQVNEILGLPEGQQFLRLADARGWAFTRNPQDGQSVVELISKEAPVANEAVLQLQGPEAPNCWWQGTGATSCQWQASGATKSNWPVPGAFTVIAEGGLLVREGLPLSTAEVATLPCGTRIDVLEVAPEMIDGRVRARILQPAGAVSLRAGEMWSVQAADSAPSIPSLEQRSYQPNVVHSEDLIREKQRFAYENQLDDYAEKALNNLKTEILTIVLAEGPLTGDNKSKILMGRIRAAQQSVWSKEGSNKNRYCHKGAPGATLGETPDPDLQGVDVSLAEKQLYRELSGVTSESVSISQGDTTIMLRNIPNKYTRSMVVEQLNLAGYRGLYDFLYLPVDLKDKSNLGYMFLNFRTPGACSRFRTEYNGVPAVDKFPGFNSSKVCAVSPARIQGCEQNVRRLQGSKMMEQLSQIPEGLPCLFDPDGMMVDFPWQPDSRYAQGRPYGSASNSQHQRMDYRSSPY